ncbi:Nif3-like dinuclear metal center hexameric protein [Saccharicrinis sp. FJH62]|uniref:Nif3-like dinuclear metal center hexameric protein n=1 Tax=Saccharicrinis sp. FJH62 TaxID=3344657 RepID=UPI0035D406FE
MIKVREITEVLEAFAPLALQESYDNAGLLVGDPDMNVRGVLVTLDVTSEVLEEAMQHKLNMIVAHHPFIFSGLKKINGKNDIEKCLITAIKNDIAIYASHTNTDAAVNGLNQKFCDLLQLKNCRTLSPMNDALVKLVTFVPSDHAEKVRQAIFDAGAGHIGNYDCCSYNLEGEGTFRALEGANPFVGEKDQLHVEKEVRIETVLPAFMQHKVVAAMIRSHPYEEVAYDVFPLKNTWNGAGIGMIGELNEPLPASDFFNVLKKTLNVSVVRHTTFLDGPVQKIAVCGGAGSFLISDAIRAKADVFITGEIKYHDFFKAENRIILADIGHFESEQFVKEVFGELLQKNFSKFAVRLSEVNTNPIKYL